MQIHERVVFALLVFVGLTSAALAGAGPETGELLREGIHDELELVGCNRAMHFTVSELEVADRVNNQSAPAGHRWLLVHLDIENRMPADLLFDLDYREELLVASVERQLYLLVNGRIVSRSEASLNTMEDEFILPHIGASRAGTVVFPIPDQDLVSLSLRYYHDQYAPVIVPLAGAEELQREPGDMATEPQRNDVLELAVAGRERVSGWQGVSAPDGMQWLVVELLGRSLWTLEADALALDRDAEIDARVELPKVMEYVEAAGLLQVVVDGRNAYPRELSLGNLPAEPPLLPDAWAGGIAVFPVPDDSGHIELAVHYPRFQGEGIVDGTPETMYFELFGQDGRGPAPTEVLTIEDDPTPLILHQAHLTGQFADRRADEGRALLRIDASMRNTSDTGGMMAISDRLSLTDADGRKLNLIGAYLRGPLPLEEPFWLPAGGQPRAFSLIYDAPDDLSLLELSYGGVSVNTREQLTVGSH